MQKERDQEDPCRAGQTFPDKEHGKDRRAPLDDGREADASPQVVVRLRKQSGMSVKELAKVSGAHPTAIKELLYVLTAPVRRAVLKSRFRYSSGLDSGA